MGRALRIALAIVLLGLAVASCPGNDTTPEPAPTTHEGAHTWP
ncbi:hypothetical protein STRCI_004493 [Streptomyces cinnabarinus]|uniref:Lipoprotein n=1 Tax=Streptomyces cinnabarinus TaxID=67287 RepID=A0ABY7KGG8_9ACTN|nr:hypothetical protein [Streptomyces cinnabarinus]WAZ23168.1 hypothetical protein STRCI_004493 [Streptomyces cinnabarinus]